MIPLVIFAFLILYWIIQALKYFIIAAAIGSWLIAFNIVNPRNSVVYQIMRFLDAITTPVLAPFRRFIPLIGGVDISPMIAWFVLQGIQMVLLPAARDALVQALGGGV